MCVTLQNTVRNYEITTGEKIKPHDKHGREDEGVLLIKESDCHVHKPQYEQHQPKPEFRKQRRSGYETEV